MNLQNFPLSKSLFWFSAFTAILGLIVVVINIFMLEANAKAGELANQRGAQIQRNNTLSNLNQSLIQGLARIGVEKKDEQIIALLANNGIKIEEKKQEGAAGNTPAAAPAAAPAAPAAAEPAPAPATTP